MIENAQRVSAIEHSKALVARSVFFDQARRFFDTCGDLLLTPQMPVGAWGADPGPKGSRGRGDRRPANADHVRPSAVHIPLQSDGSAGSDRALRLQRRRACRWASRSSGRWHADAVVLRRRACFEAAQPWGPGPPAPGLTPRGETISTAKKIHLSLSRAV